MCLWTSSTWQLHDYAFDLVALFALFSYLHSNLYWGRCVDDYKEYTHIVKNIRLDLFLLLFFIIVNNFNEKTKPTKHVGPKTHWWIWLRVLLDELDLTVTILDHSFHFIYLLIFHVDYLATRKSIGLSFCDDLDHINIVNIRVRGNILLNVSKSVEDSCMWCNIWFAYST